MKYNIYINQYAAHSMGLKVDFDDLIILDVISSGILSGHYVRTIVDNIDYYWIQPKAIINEIPLMGITSASSLRRRIDNLVNAGLLERCPDNEVLNKCFVKLGSRYEEYVFSKMNNPAQKRAGTLLKNEQGLNIDNIYTRDSNNIITTTDNTITPYNPPEGEERESLRSYAEKLYAIYPAKDVPSVKYPQGRPTGKSKKDIDKIERLLKRGDYTPQGLEAIMQRYISECSGFLKNLATFLNSIPDYDGDGIDITLPLKKGKYDDYQ